MEHLLLTVVCAIAIGTAFQPPEGWTVTQITAGDEKSEAILSTTIAYGEPFRWPHGCQSVDVKPLGGDE